MIVDLPENRGFTTLSLRTLQITDLNNLEVNNRYKNEKNDRIRKKIGIGANCPLDIARGAIDKIGASEEEIEKREETLPHLVGPEQGRGPRGTCEGFRGPQNERCGHHGIAGQLGG